AAVAGGEINLAEPATANPALDHESIRRPRPAGIQKFHRLASDRGDRHGSWLAAGIDRSGTCVHVSSLPPAAGRRREAMVAFASSGFSSAVAKSWLSFEIV